jgi:hypothetical protein
LEDFVIMFFAVGTSGPLCLAPAVGTALPGTNQGLATSLPAGFDLTLLLFVVLLFAFRFSGDGGLSSGAIAGIVVGVVIGVALVAAIVGVVVHKQSNASALTNARGTIQNQSAQNV